MVQLTVVLTGSSSADDSDADFFRVFFAPKTIDWAWLFIPSHCILPVPYPRKDPRCHTVIFKSHHVDNCCSFHVSCAEFARVVLCCACVCVCGVWCVCVVSKMGRKSAKKSRVFFPRKKSSNKFWWIFVVFRGRHSRRPSNTKSARFHTKKSYKLNHESGVEFRGTIFGHDRSCRPKLNTPFFYCAWYPFIFWPLSSSIFVPLTPSESPLFELLAPAIRVILGGAGVGKIEVQKWIFRSVIEN
jgi:hypothetical protein